MLLAVFALGGCKAEFPATARQPATAIPAPVANAAAAAASVVASAATALNPLASPEDAVKASMRKFIAASFHQASMEMEAGARSQRVNQLEFVASDRYRMTLQGLGTQVIIGDTMYMRMRSKHMAMPLPAGTLSQWRDPARLDQNATGMTVQALGHDTVDGQPAHRYLIHHDRPQPSDVTMWIGSDDLPIQLQVGGQCRWAQQRNADALFALQRSFDRDRRAEING